MEFAWGDGTVKWTTNAADQIQEVGTRSIERMIKRGCQCYPLYIKSIPPDTQAKLGNLHPSVIQILNNFATVLSEP